MMSTESSRGRTQDRDEALDLLRSYAERYEATGDAAGILDEAVAARARDAMSLVLRVEGLDEHALYSVVDAELAAAIGTVFWYRHRAARNEAEWEVALEFFGLAHRVDPQAVPEPIRSILLGPRA
jgi:hypothetical protein